VKALLILVKLMSKNQLVVEICFLW